MTPRQSDESRLNELAAELGIDRAAIRRAAEERVRARHAAAAQRQPGSPAAAAPPPAPEPPTAPPMPDPAPPPPLADGGVSRSPAAGPGARKAKDTKASKEKKAAPKPRKTRAPSAPEPAPILPPAAPTAQPSFTFGRPKPGRQPTTPTAAAPAPGGFRPTEEQTAAVAGAKRLRQAREGAMRLIAYAGAGKTSTLRLIASQAYQGASLLYVAFNRSIAQDAAKSMPSNVDTRTMHSVARRALGVGGGDPGRLNGTEILEALGEDGWCDPDLCLKRKPISQARLVSLVIREFCQSADTAIGKAHVATVLDRFVGRELPGGKTDAKIVEARRNLAPVLLEKARAAWPRFATLTRCPAHDVYLKMFELNGDLVRRTMAEYQALLLDEAQDVNPVMRSICEQSGRPIIAVGDSFQQIYSWRGAEDALERLPGERLYLSQSFRFGPAVAEVAMRILSTKPSGGPPVPLRGNPAKASRVLVGGTAPVVIARTNAGVLRAAVQAARSGAKVHIVGGIDELAEEVRSAVALFEKRPRDVRTETLKRFPDWGTLKAEATETDDPTLRRLVDAVEKDDIARDLALLERSHVASERDAAVICTTAHKSKGREWPAVELASDWAGTKRMHGRYSAACKAAAEGGGTEGVRSALEEWNVLYVAATRGIDRLCLPPKLADLAGQMVPPDGYEDRW